MVRALLAPAAGAPLEIRELDLPRPGPGEVRVRIAAAGVCHSDLSHVNGTLAPRYPLVLGHEAAGTVEAAGDQVSRVRPGQKVVLNWAPPCRACWFCTHGEPWLCALGEKATPRVFGILTGGASALACLGLGAFAEAVVVPETAVVALPDDVGLDVAALLGCAVLTGMGAVEHTAAVRPGDSVAVLGLGGVGLSAVAAARLAGATTIIAVDRAAAKADLAYTLGATHFLPAGEKLAREVRQLTDGRGVDHALECIGRAATIRMAWQCTRRGGQATVVGMGRRDDHVSFGALELYHFARTLTVSIYGACDPDRDIPAYLQRVRAGDFDPLALVTERIGLDQIPEAFSRMERGQGARSLVVLDPAALG